MDLAPSTVTSYIVNVRAFAVRLMGEREDRSARAWPLVLSRVAAWMPPRVDSRPAIDLPVFQAAVQDPSADRTVCLALAFAFDTVSRSSDYLDNPRGFGFSSAGPVPLSQIRVGKDALGGTVAELVKITKGSRGKASRVRASSRVSSAAFHPCGYKSATALTSWVSARREAGASPSEPLWLRANGRCVSSNDVVSLLQRHTPHPVSRHSIRISSASIAVSRGLMTLASLATLGGWKDESSCRSYVRSLVSS